MNWKTSAPFYGIMDIQKALFKSPCLRKLCFSTVNQKKDRKSVEFTWSSFGLANFFLIFKSKPRPLSTDVTELLNLALFLQREKFCLQFMKMFYPPSTMVVYQYVCRCVSRYVGRTSQRLQDRINQHIRRCIRSDKRPTKILPNRECKIISNPTVYSDSGIGQHLLENEEFAKHYNHAPFSILATARSSFHLSVLEATYINSLQPILCRQKEFVYSLQILH